MIAILGLGNLLMSDDGVGVHALRALAADPPPAAVLRDVGTSILDALDVVERATHVIAIDAIDAGRRPGTVLRLELDPADPSPPPPSLHDLNLSALVRTLPPASRPRVTVVGVQPGTIAPGLELSPAVGAALPRLLEEVRSVAAACG